jgi:hypothetical protein
VLDCAEDLGADLIVIGAQHKRFRDETIIGTTTERLVRFARVPVLTVPRRAAAEAPHKDAVLGLAPAENHVHPLKRCGRRAHYPAKKESAMDNTGRLIAIVLLASFAIERVVATVDFLMDGDALTSPEKKRKLTLFGMSAFLGIVVVWLTGIRILAVLNVKTESAVDILLTWMILVGGADKLSQLLGGGSGGGNSKPDQEIPPIKIYIGDKDASVAVEGLPPGR